jgi:hypothetical protein
MLAGQFSLTTPADDEGTGNLALLVLIGDLFAATVDNPDVCST